MEYEIILFYKYTPIENTAELADRERASAHELGIKGRLIVATEGINGTFEGEKEQIAKYCCQLHRDPRFSDVVFKKSKGNGTSFPKLSVKVRDEIVSAHLKDDDDVKPWERTGTHLAPEMLRRWYKEGKKFTVVDMRNDYEYASGHFRGSAFSGMKHFRDLAKTPEKISHLKDETVVTVCTGGVRCEKASAYLLKQGFKDVYQLDGGIVSYMKKYPGEDFLGTLYTFDGRVTMDFVPATEREVVGKCLKCASATERYINCSNHECHEHYLLCETCERERGGLCCECETGL